jgi:hypothetical protein
MAPYYRRTPHFQFKGAYLCFYATLKKVCMRTTIDLPDALFRRTKALAAARGVTLKQLIINAVEREITPAGTAPVGKQRTRLPLIHLEPGRVLDLTDFDFDDLLA